MGIIEDMNPTPNHPPQATPQQTPTPPPTPSPPPAPKETEPLAASVSREEAWREVRPPQKQTCDRCWQMPEAWEESGCEYNDRVRVTCRVCGKFIG